MMECAWGQRGAPWEFNLRDVFRWCDLMVANQAPGCYDPGQWVHQLYADRMRTSDDKRNIVVLYGEAEVGGVFLDLIVCHQSTLA